jgi:hypothetical protein
MFLQTTLNAERLVTVIAAERPLPAVHTSMPLQIALMTECLTAHIAAKWLLSTLHMPMCPQVKMLTEHLVTLATRISPLVVMHGLNSVQSTLQNERKQ